MIQGRMDGDESSKRVGEGRQENVFSRAFLKTVEPDFFFFFFLAMALPQETPQVCSPRCQGEGVTTFTRRTQVGVEVSGN